MSMQSRLQRPTGSRSLARTAFILLATFVFLTSGISCSKPGDPDKKEVTVFAAASLADVLREIGDQFQKSEHIAVIISLGASGRLAAQLEQGAPCDVYIPADPAYLDRLAKAGKLLTDTRTLLAGNELVVVQRGNAQTPWNDLAKIKQADIKPIAMANPDQAPVGQYAKEALTNAGYWDAIREKIIYAEDARFAARYVADGAAAIGLVYATDAAAFRDKVSIVYRFAEKDHSEIRYEGAVCTQSHSASHAAAFLKFASSPAVRDIWKKNGFIEPGLVSTSQANR